MPTSTTSLPTWKIGFSLALVTLITVSHHSKSVEGRASPKLDELDTNRADDTTGHHPALRSIPANHTLARRQDVAELQPLVNHDFPDPFLIAGTVYTLSDDANSGGFEYHLYGGHGTEKRLNVQRLDVHIDRDFKAYTEAWDLDPMEALFKVGGRVNKWDDYAAYDDHGVTSPYVYKLPDQSKYIMYYSAIPQSLADKRWHCIGTATSEKLTDTFVPDDNVWVCPEKEGGASDPSVFHDPLNDRTYIIYKIDAHLTHTGTGLVDIPIMAQEVQRNDANTKIGEAFKIFSSTQDYQWNKETDFDSLRSPQMTFKGEIYSLTYTTGPSSTPTRHTTRHAWSRKFDASAPDFQGQGGDVVGSVYYTDIVKDNIDGAVSNWVGTIASRIEQTQYILVFNTYSVDLSRRYVSACTLSTTDSINGVSYPYLSCKQGLGPAKLAMLLREVIVAEA